MRPFILKVAACVAGAFLLGGAIGIVSQLGDPDVEQALAAAIDDERLAIGFYQQVMDVHGPRRPFSNIIEAERRHEAALLSQYRRLGIEPPANRWSGHQFDVPTDFAKVCDAAADAEIRNGQLYDRLIADCDDDLVREVFKSLRDASVERHLPAFQRHGSGWHAVDPASFNPAQQVQLKQAIAARDGLSAGLLSELSRALAVGSAADAIDVCETRAPVIAREVAEQHGVRIGRTSFRLRNLQNKAPIWADLAVDDRPESTTVLVDRNGRLGSIHPIVLAPTCLQCHGSADDIMPATRAAIEARYPHDQATGFAAGDLRGWFWVEVPPLNATTDQKP